MIREFLTRLRGLLHRDQLDADLSEEIAHHQSMKQSRFGNRTYWQEETREQWTFPRLEALASDVRLAFRRLTRDKAFSQVAIATLTLGIGATTAIFSLLNGLLWRPLPVPDPDQLVRLVLTHLPPTERHWVDGRPVPALERTAVSHAMYESLTRHSNPFTGFFALAGTGNIHVDNGGQPRQVKFAVATGSMFDVLGVQARAGRFFSADDDVPGGRAGNTWPAVISDALWDSMFSRSAAAIGANIVVDRVPFVIAGVAPPAFKGLMPGSEVDLWLPLLSTEQVFPLFRWRHDRSIANLRVFARLKPDASHDQAAGYLRAVAPAVMAESIDPARTGDQRKHLLAMQIEPRPGRSGFSMLAVSYARPLTILMMAGAALLLVASINLTSLFLARAVARRHELAIRVSLGAPASRLRRELWLESLVLAAAGVAGGFVLGQGLAGALQSLVGAGVRIDTSFDPRLFGFLALVLAMVTFVAGFGPALHYGRTQPQTALKSATGSPGALRLRGGLIVLQTALSLALTGGAGMMAASLKGLISEATGFDATGSLVLWPDLFNAGITRTQMPQAYRRILDNLRALPQVEAAGWTDTLPLSGRLATLTVDVPGQPDLPVAKRDVFCAWVSDGYLTAAGLRLLAGRDLPGPESGRGDYAMLSENAARLFFGSAHGAIGQRLKPANQDWIEITGVVSDAKYFNVRDGHPPTMYLPYWSQVVRPGLSLAVRHRGSGASALAAVTGVLGQEAGRAPYYEVHSVERQLRAAAGTERILAWLLGAIAILALVISATGLAGLLSYLVEQRRRDFGVRLALGATAWHVRGLILRHGLTLSFAGLALGGLLSFSLRRTLDAFLYGVKPADPKIWLACVVLLMAAALAASAAPAWRASRIDPIRMLRSD